MSAKISEENTFWKGSIWFINSKSNNLTTKLGALCGPFYSSD